MAAFEMPGDVLQRHAYANVWCTPDQDMQIRFKPARISPINGQWYEFTHMWRKIALPTKQDRYHIYQIGGIDPELLGLTSKVNKWFSIPEVMAEHLVMVDVYTGSGFQIPRHLVYYRYTDNLNLIVAIRRPDVELAGWDWETNEPFIRLYSNAYFESVRSKSVAQYIGCISRRPLDRTAVAQFIADVNAMPFTQGTKYFYVNGRFTPTVNLATIANGDYVDCIYDSSIKRVVDFYVSNLKEFNSTLDGIRKFLLHYTKGNEAAMIEFEDDVDAFLYRTEGNFTRGVYVHKNSETTLRMVTHRDYAISIPVLDAATSSSGIFKPNSVRMLRLHIRHSGYARPLVHEANRIHELYRLKTTAIPQAMLGVNATLPEWRAPNLEAAMYTKIMRSPSNAISRDMVKQAYGYHAISKLIGDSPMKTELFSGRQVCKVPTALWGNATAYEYNANGVLLGWYYHTAGETYTATNSTCRLVEFVYGQGGETLDLSDDVSSGPVNITNNYRFYYCDRVFGVPTLDWKRATSGMYLISGGIYNWVASSARSSRVLSNLRHLAYEFNYTAADGVIRFNLVRKRPDGVYVKLDMPLGELDIWLNRHRLVEGLDYVMKFLEVVILNTAYLNNGGLGAQTVTVRFKGFCDDDMKPYQVAEKGFVVHNTVSHNFKYNMREDHVVDICVGGRTYHRNDVKFAEDGVVPAALSVNNGKPYFVRNSVVPINGYIVDVLDYKDPTYEMLAVAQEVDDRMEEYLTRYRPQATVANVSMIPGKWKVVSPFFSKVITDLRDGILWDDGFTQYYGSEYVQQVIQPYLTYLDLDLARADGLHDPNYVAIAPHPYTSPVLLNAYQHKFLRFVYELYGMRVMQLADFVQIKPFN